MIDDMFKVLGENAAEILFEIITESMDDYLYIFDGARSVYTYRLTDYEFLGITVL